MQQAPKYDVFICHSSKDKPVIATLIEDFKKENITYWVDSEQIDFGESIIEKITEGLETSKYVVPCVSKNLKSGWTRAEYGSALNAEFGDNSKKRVIPLLLEDCDVNDIPILLRDKKRVVYSDHTNFNDFIKFLKKNQNEQKKVDDPLKKEMGELRNQKGGKSEHTEIPETITSPSIGIKLFLIRAGEFNMGSPLNENVNSHNEIPYHEVKIKNDFYMGVYPVTQTQWKKIMRSNPSHFKHDDRPVESVSWDDAQEFIKKLNELDKTDKYRLPTEAEWEYACRAGTTTRYSFGNNESKLVDYAWFKENSNDLTHLVGKKNPNHWGLYDMHGNVWEWCQDEWHDSYKDAAPNDGSAWESDSCLARVVRGGSWNYEPARCRSASRWHCKPSFSNDEDGYPIDDVGFRLVRDV